MKFLVVVTPLSIYHYTKAYLEQVAANATHTNTEEITQILRLLKYFEDLFGGNLGECYTEPVYLELNTDYKPFHCKNQRSVG